MESQPQNPQLRNNPENFHHSIIHFKGKQVTIFKFNCYSVLKNCFNSDAASHQGLHCFSICLFTPIQPSNC